VKPGKTVIGLIQSTPENDFSANLGRSLALTRRAAQKGAKIICLPELYRSKYFPQADKVKAAAFAETIPGESTRAFSALAKELKVVIAVPLFEKAGNKFYNSVAVLDADGALLDTYRKVHIPHDPLFYEKSYFAPGDRGYKVFRTRYADFSVLICYDQWFPEAARASVLASCAATRPPRATGARPGRRSSAGMPSPTRCTWPRSTAWASRAN
jgi:predicted amidohydrolase